MARYNVALCTSWTGSGTMQDPRRPAFIDAYPGIAWTDITGQPSQNLTPNPNLFTILVTVPDDTTLTKIANDTRFLILYTEVIPNAS